MFAINRENVLECVQDMHVRIGAVIIYYYVYKINEGSGKKKKKHPNNVLFARSSPVLSTRDEYVN